MRGVRGPGAGISRRHFHNIQMRGEGETEARNCVPWGTREIYIRRGGTGEEGGGGGRTGRRMEGARAAWYAAAWCCRLTYLSAATPPATGARGIRTERCFAHLYPRSGDSPVRRPVPRPRSTLPILATSLSSPPPLGPRPKRPPRPRPRSG